MLSRPLLAMLLAVAAPLSAVEIVAHRGFSARAPENTVAAFQLAWKSGADACELDLHLTADGGIAVLHDKDTQRTTGTALVAAATPLAELRRLDAGSWKAPEYAGERIPSLAEALATLPADRGRFLLEIKCGPEVVPELARQLEAWKPRAQQLCIIAFDRAAARAAKKALPWVRVYRLSSEQTRDKKPVDLDALIADSVADGLDGLDLSQKWAWDAAFVRRVRAAGLEVHVWTVNKPEDVRRLVALGVDSITTDDPVMAREALRR